MVRHGCFRGSCLQWHEGSTPSTRTWRARCCWLHIGFPSRENGFDPRCSLHLRYNCICGVYGVKGALETVDLPESGQYRLDTPFEEV